MQCPFSNAVWGLLVPVPLSQQPSPRRVRLGPEIHLPAPRLDDLLVLAALLGRVVGEDGVVLLGEQGPFRVPELVRPLLVQTCHGPSARYAIAPQPRNSPFGSCDSPDAPARVGGGEANDGEYRCEKK